MISSSLLNKNVNFAIGFLTILFLVGNHHQKAMAQQIPVMGVSPFDQTPAENDPFNSISGSSIPPLPNRTPATDTITINGESTPHRSPVPTNTAGVGSSQSLPSPPNLSEPYRAPTDTTSVSPYNQTPTSNTANPTAVQTNPAPNNNPPTATTPTTTTPPANNANIPIQRRRSMREILVFDRPNPVSTNNNTTVVNLPSNNPINTNSGAFRVFVRANNVTEESRVKEIYPEAFRSNYQGNVVWQVGLFSSRQNAEQAAQPLRSLGLSPILAPAN